MFETNEPKFYFEEIVGLCSFPGFDIKIGTDTIDVQDVKWGIASKKYPKNVGYYLQVQCKGFDNVTGEAMEWKGRKWRLSQFMTTSEVVQTAFKAVLTAVEHETREKFKYRGVSIFDPHYDVEKLVALRSQSGALSERAAH